MHPGLCRQRLASAGVALLGPRSGIGDLFSKISICCEQRLGKIFILSMPLLLYWEPGYLFGGGNDPLSVTCWFVGSTTVGQAA